MDDGLCREDGRLAIIPKECKGGIDFTLAFENYILILVPAAVLLLLAPLRISRIWLGSRKVVGPSILHTIKALSALCFIGFSLATLIVSTHLSKTWRPSEIAAASVTFAASLVCLALSHLEHFRSIKPSALLQLYLLIAVIVEAVHLRTVWIRSDNITLKLVCCCQLVSCAVFLASESAHKESILATRKRRSPQDVNDLFSERFLWWLNKLFKHGYRNVIAPKDLYDIDEELASPEAQRAFRLTWLVETTKKPKVSLYRILFVSLKRFFLFPIIPRFLLLAITFAQPYLIQRFVGYIENPRARLPNEGPLLVLAAACLYVAIATVQAWYWQCCNRFQTKLRGTLIAAIHEKALRARPTPSFSPLMLMNVDVEKAVNGLRTQHEFWSVSLSMIISLILLQGQVGLSFLGPTLMMIVLALIIWRDGGDTAPKQKAWLASTQTRVSFVSNIIASMKNIKLMGLTRVIQDMGTKLRETEVDKQRDVRKSIYVNLMIAQFTFQLCAAAMYGGYAIKTRLGGPPLTNSNLFSSLAILKLFTSPLVGTIQYIPQFLQAVAALSRVQTYLLSEEHHDARRQLPSALELSNTDDSDVIVRLDKVTASYADQSPTVLDCVDLKIDQGKIYMVLGAVGSGKSTLLKTMLGETHIKNGSVCVGTFDIAFCDQIPWLWNGTVRQNIVGDEEYNSGWFDQVVWACGLEEDFIHIPLGADARTGDDGASLSGGQKNRISLARAIYSRKRLFLADDILAGLDTTTEALVFARCFGASGLLRKTGSTVVLATHSVGWRKYVDNVIIMDAGQISYQGGPTSIPSCFAALMSHEASMDNDHIFERPEKDSSTTIEDIVDEEASTVPRDKSIYLEYMRSFGYKSVIFYLVIGMAPNVCKSMEQIWLKWWAAENITEASLLAKFASIFCAIIVVNIITMSVEIWWALIVMCRDSSLYFHALQWKALMEAAFAHWGSMDNGSIANRFSQDMMVVDMQLSMSALNLTSIVYELIANLILMLVATPFIAAALPVIGAVLYVVQKVYLRTSKQLRVMDLEAKAPLCAHFLQTASGVVTVTAFGWAEKNREKAIQLLGKSQVPFYLLLSIQQWLQLVLDLIVAGLATALMAICVAIAQRLDAGYLGIALLQIMDIGQFLGLLVLNWTTFDTSLGAVARIKDFCRKMPQEQQGELTPPKDWLAQGAIEISNLVASYSPTAESTLRGVSLTIKPGTKLAICGRTGSGKSSLASALFGLLHVQSGTILIDGVDVTKVSQDELRARMVALPQEPYFRPGTVRENLVIRTHERETASDVALISALESVGLLSKFQTLSRADGDRSAGPLDVSLDNPADVLTRGQQQLFAMARTILSRGSILVVDEATSGLDAESDRLVQKLLRGAEMRGRTIIAIAHRLHTIMDFDTVVVMDKGDIVEVGCPAALVGGGGRFDALVRSGGTDSPASGGS